VTRSVTTVITGTGALPRSRARVAGSAVSGWKLTITAGRQPVTALATPSYTDGMSVRLSQPRARGELARRQVRPHNHGASRMTGPYSPASQRTQRGAPGPHSGSQMNGSKRPG
jgi:hypothetical protein